jgi:hypothetical protein
MQRHQQQRVRERVKRKGKKKERNEKKSHSRPLPQILLLLRQESENRSSDVGAKITSCTLEKETTAANTVTKD